jgi:hypothetical protein
MIYDEIFNNLKEIIQAKKNYKNVYDTFKVTEDIIKNKGVLFKKNPNMKKILNGSAFGMESNSNSIFIYFGTRYLDTYSKESSLHYTILIHELKHLYDWSRNKDTFFKSTEKEKSFYEFAARKTEAEFIKNYLEGKFNLTKLEKLILDSYNKDGLNSFISLFQRVDKNIFFIFKELEDDYRNNKISEEEIIVTLVNGAIQIIDRFDASSENSLKFSNYISIKSFRNCLEDIVLKKKNNVIAFNDLYSKYNYYLYDKYTRLYDIIENNHDFYSKYSFSLDKELEEKYMI